MSATQTVTEVPVLYFDTERCLNAAMYIGAALAAILTCGLIFYSIITHASMNRLIADPAMAALTADRFFNILYMDLGCAGLSAAIFIKLYGPSCGKETASGSRSFVRGGVLGRRQT